MNIVKRSLYRGFGLSLRVYQRLTMRIHVWGREHLTPGPKIFVCNHISSVDPFYFFFPYVSEPIHFVVGPAYDSKFNRKFLDSFEQINALDNDGRTVVGEAVDYLKRGESIGIYPEGDIQAPGRVGKFHTGVARIYLEARVPLVPIALVTPAHCLKELSQHNQVVDGRIYRMVVAKRGPYCISVGKPWLPEVSAGSDVDQVVALTSVIQQRLTDMVEEIRLEKFWL